MKLTEDMDLGPVVKDYVIQLLLSEGYGTYAERLQDIQFHCVHVYKGSYCAVAFMSPKDMCMVVNPGFTVDMLSFGPIFSQLSVIVRHELLHFLLCHEDRFIEHLKKTDKNFAQSYRTRADLHTIANFAMDYELGNYGYDDHDKEVVRAMKLNGEFIGGLLSEEVTNSETRIFGNGIYGVETLTGAQFNNWENKSFEEMFQMLRDAHEKLMQANKQSGGNSQGKKTTIVLKKETHSQEYTEAYNKVMQLYDNDKFSNTDLENLLKQVDSGKDII